MQRQGYPGEWVLPYGVGGRRRRVRRAVRPQGNGVMPINIPPGGRLMPVPRGEREEVEEVLLKVLALGTEMNWNQIAEAVGVDYVTIWRYRQTDQDGRPVSSPDRRAQRSILTIYDQSVLRGRDPREVLAKRGIPLPPWAAAPRQTT